MTLRPQYLEALCGRAVALKYLGRFEEALEGFDAAWRVTRPRHTPIIIRRRSCFYAEIFEQGLELYEYRWFFAETPKQALTHPVPEWKGEDPDCCSILVFDEQGHGDAIQLARYLLLLSERGARVSFFCRKRLHRLFKRIDGPVRIIDCVQPHERYDYQIALSSLPRAFKTRLATIPQNCLISPRRRRWWKTGRRGSGRRVLESAFAGEAIQTSRPTRPARSLLLAS